MIGLSTTLKVVTDDCDEEIFHKTSRGAFHTSMFTRTVATTDDISFLTGKYKTIKKKLKSTPPYHLESRPIFITPLRVLIEQQLSPSDDSQEGFCLTLKSLINMCDVASFHFTVLSGMCTSVAFSISH